MHEQFLQTMLSQIKRDTPHASDVVETIERIGSVGNSIAVIRDRLAGDNRLTDHGRRSQVSEIVRKEKMKEMADVTRRLRRSLAYVHSERTALVNGKFETPDTLTEMRSQEIRSFLRSVPPSQRDKLSQELCQSPEGAAAVLDAPAFLSGLDDMAMERPQYGAQDRLRQARAQALHGPRLQELAAIEDDYRVAEATAASYRTVLFEASGLTRDGFEEAMRPLEAEADAR